MIGEKRRIKLKRSRVDSQLLGCKNCFTDYNMNDHELHRVVQYVTASTSYARDTVSDILHTGLGELSALAAHSTRPFEREALLEYVSQWTIKRTGQPEPLVREVLGCAGGRDGDQCGRVASSCCG